MIDLKWFVSILFIGRQDRALLVDQLSGILNCGFDEMWNFHFTETEWRMIYCKEGSWLHDWKI